MIRFDNPGALWLLTLILPLLLLYLLKRKRREILVPSTLLWKKAVEDARASTPFQKLRSSLLLLLQVLILVLLTAILSRPHFLQTSQSSMQWILAIDSSASMSSTDEKPDRFNIAKEKLLDALKEIPTNDEVMLMNFSSSTSIIQPFTRNHSIVRTKLVELHAEDVAGDWQQLAQILEPLYRQKPAPRILIASDFANFPENLKQELHFDPLYSGKSGENVAITRAALEPLPENPKNQALFYEIKNFGKEGRSIDVEIRLNSEVMDAYQARLEPSQAINRSAELIIEAPAEIKILVQPEDAFRLDNDFVLNVVPQEKIPLQLEAQNPFLERALGVLPSIKISPAGDPGCGIEIWRGTEFTNGTLFHFRFR